VPPPLPCRSAASALIILCVCVCVLVGFPYACSASETSAPIALRRTCLYICTCICVHPLSMRFSSSSSTSAASYCCSCWCAACDASLLGLSYCRASPSPSLPLLCSYRQETHNGHELRGVSVEGACSRCMKLSCDSESTGSLPHSLPTLRGREGGTTPTRQFCSFMYPFRRCSFRDVSACHPSHFLHFVSS
jgi:hypothetical protein